MMGERGKNGGAKQLTTERFSSLPDAIEAHKELSKSVREKNEALWKEQASKDPSLHGLELGPENPADAEEGKAYFRPNRKKNQSVFKRVPVSMGRKEWAGPKPAKRKGAALEQKPVTKECQLL